MRKILYESTCSLFIALNINQNSKINLSVLELIQRRTNKSGLCAKSKKIIVVYVSIISILYRLLLFSTTLQITDCNW